MFMLALVGWASGNALAEDRVCARVKIEIEQEVTLERQAFEASMRLDNSGSEFSLDEIAIDVLFRDEVGDPVVATSDTSAPDASFFIRLSSVEGIADISGNGTLDPGATAEITWLIIPAIGAAKGEVSGAIYFVGAQIRYRLRGQFAETDVAPDLIVVRAMPELILDYFLEREVRADDTFTPQIEPIEPFTLGVRIRNDGIGAAKRARIATAQPRIIENRQGLLIGFAIEAASIDDEPNSPNLLVDFGEIAPGGSRVGRWSMTATLAGEFVEFSATVAHSDELGGELTSLIREANTHSLIRDVRVDLSGRDHVRDFLAHDDDAIRVYESDSVDTQVSDLSDVSLLSHTGTQGDVDIYTLTVPPTAGFLFVKLPDPAAGQREIRRVLRADGKSILPENAWLQTSGTGSETTHSLSVFDVNGGGTYRIELGTITLGEMPPVIQFVPDRTTSEGQQIGFLVEASDPNGTIPVLSTGPLPVGATFEDEGDGVGFFHWIPAVGQAGSYPVTFRASDGLLSASRTATIRVLGQGSGGGDVDGDGLDDEWERRFFGGTERDGSGDFDDDGVSDLDEFERGTDPTFAGIGSVPVIAVPRVGGEVATLRPELSVHNSTHGQTVVGYDFELYVAENASNPIASALGVDEGESTTSWTPALDLVENDVYRWRARLVDAGSPTDWVFGVFRVNAVNEPPTAPLLSFPEIGAVVSSATPTLETSASIDPEDDAVRYELALYRDAELSDPLLQIGDIAPASPQVVSITVPIALSDGGTYWWQVAAVDEHGARSWSSVGRFVVDLSNAAPGAPMLIAPGDGARVTASSVDLVVVNATDAEGDALTYVFEIDVAPDFASGEQRTFGPVAGGASETRATVDGLVEDADHFWRVKANDGRADGPWAYGAFFVSAVDSAPGAPSPLAPGNGAVIELRTPTLVVTDAVDPDRDVASYEFEVYRDAALTDGVAAGVSTTTAWSVEPSLDGGRSYHWRARARDARDQAGPWSEASTFEILLDTADDPPTIEIVEPDRALIVAGGVVRIRWVDADPDSNATITLMANGAPIADAIAEDPDGDGDVFDWVVGAWPPGEYAISAKVTDGVSEATAQACCSVTILPSESDILADLVTPASIDEWGLAEARVGVVLKSAPLPGASVVVPVASSDPTEARVVSATQLLTFTSDNWSDPQEVTIVGVDDCEVDGDQPALVRIGPATSSDARFSGKSASDIALTTADNESPGQTLFICEYEEVSRSTVQNSPLVDVTLRPILSNRGIEARSPGARVLSRSPEIEIIGDPMVGFPVVLAGGRELSLDTITVRFEGARPLDRAKLEWQIDGAVPRTNPPQDSYLCYGAAVRDGEPRFQKRDKLLRDQVDPLPVPFEVTRPISLCTAPDVEGASPLNPSVHQAVFDVRRKPGASRFEPRTVAIRDRYGEQSVEIRDPSAIFEPASATSPAGGIPQAPSNNQGGVDRFKCYDARPVSRPVARDLAVRVVDGFFSQGKQFDLAQVVRLCAPMDKSGETPTAPDHTVHLACYRAKPRPAGQKFTKTFVSTNNSNFGAGVWTLSAPDELCVPALVSLGTGSPPVSCGDGFREGAEQCDDGNRIADDGCQPDCTR